MSLNIASEIITRKPMNRKANKEDGMANEWKGMHNGKIKNENILDSRRNRQTHAERTAKIIQRSLDIEYGLRFGIKK
jgi:hypothetical protein